MKIKNKESVCSLCVPFGSSFTSCLSDHVVGCMNRRACVQVPEASPYLDHVPIRCREFLIRAYISASLCSHPDQQYIELNAEGIDSLQLSSPQLAGSKHLLLELCSGSFLQHSLPSLLPHIQQRIAPLSWMVIYFRYQRNVRLISGGSVLIYNTVQKSTQNGHI